MGRREKPKQKKNHLLTIIFVIVLLALSGLLVMKIVDSKNNTVENSGLFSLNEKPLQEEKEIKIFNGDERPIAVVLENSTKDDWPHPGLENAYLVYEIIVEGGFTKLMPIYKGEDVEEIGYIRSARPYFIDYALENDAVLVHYGHTIMTAEDEDKLKIDYIDGFKLSSSDKTFTTVPGYTTGYAKRIVASSESIKTKMKKSNIRTTSTDTGLNYVAEDYDLENVTDETGNTTNIVNSIKISYSNSHSVSYTYDEETKQYERFQRGAPHLTTNNIQLKTKNIIVQFAEDTALGDTREVPDKGYRRLHNIGSGEGYFITNGKCIEITWKKDSRNSKTKYLDKDGNEIKLNDGITYVQICPIDAEVKID